MDQKKANLGSPKCFKRTLLGITNKCGTNGSFLTDEQVLKKNPFENGDCSSISFTYGNGM